MKKRFRVLALALTLVMTLTACGGGGAEKETGSAGKGEKTTTTSERSAIAKHEGDPIEGGVFKIGLVTDSPFVGVFSEMLYQDNFDWEIMGDTMYATFESGADQEIKSSGAVDIEFDEETKTVTIVNKDVFKWSDGTPVTAADWEFVYKVIGHPEYTGIRYDSDYMNVVGMDEYHAGETDEISGIEMPDEKTIKITFKEFTPGILWGGGIPFNPAPKHQLENIPVKDLEGAPEVRETPLSSGPFVISKVTPGQKVEFVKNEHFWKGAPKIDGVEVEVLPSSSALASLKSSKYDYITPLPGDIQLEDLEDLDGYTILERDEAAYTYIGFKLGKWNAEKNEVEVDPNAKMADPNLRKAMGYALDNDSIGEKFYHGLRRQANSLIIPVFSNFHDETLEGYNYDPEKAKKLLDEAGFKDVDGDGYREDKDGNELVINFASMSGGDIAEPLAMAYIQWWKDIGLNVKLTNDRLIEFQAFYEMVDADDPGIDIYQAAWGTGSNPDPNGLYSRYAPFNRPRYIDENIEKALNDIASSKSLDADFRKEAYRAFDEAMFESAPVIPTLFRKELRPINKRVKFYDWSYPDGSDEPGFRFSDIELTADKPM
ncbi:oligopeptide ABC transporter substrate-binding protein [Miniphocaeibacter halophilus]|uniref:Oligopeptide ABC transporter substrate-binding protein n=1 Tax=Miniphocaeibacter halophilus TaxID=2931922 RepID=A0AC61MTP7_9FIRM|nr:oligopeptide ABC transporter substrate-binding protein [Miniphocaeibacter halophilus]QQK09037.1 oligopeptide ABC transporter substrate-binding protein [Miniphocaeibacter halophilus]